MGLLRRSGPTTPDLVPVPAMADLPQARLRTPARYLGTVRPAGERVREHGLAGTSTTRLNLSREALDVVRVGGSFRVPLAALRGATTAPSFLGKPVEGLLVVRWTHGEQEWHTGFRLDPTSSLQAGPSAPDTDRWVRTISKMCRSTA